MDKVVWTSRWYTIQLVGATIGSKRMLRTDLALEIPTGLGGKSRPIF